jgi:CubicO group peptidase (beta-lactamase class C family)
VRSSRRFALLAVVASVALLAGCAVVPDRQTPGAPITGTLLRDRIAELSERSDEAVAELIPVSEPGCSAAVGVDGTVVWAGAGGLADLAAGTPLTTQTRFDIASVSKQFTATAILMLQRDGLLSVSDPVGAYVGGMPSWAGTVTIDQLIHHTSRIPDYWQELEDVGIRFGDAADQKTTLQAIARETKLDPGSGFQYSNSNYVLLAEVVQSVSGQALPDFLADRVFAPLGLNMAVAPTARAADIALSYDDDLQLQEPAWSNYGHSGIITTPSELVRWGDQYRTGDIVQDDFAVGAVDEGSGEQYGAGIDIEADGDLNHTGRFGGYISEFTVSADREMVIAVICNGHAANRFPLADALWAIWDPPSSE